MGSSTAPRSPADELRRWDDARLAALLRARLDLAHPPPADLRSLAARAVTRASVQRALDGLDQACLQVVDVLAVLPEPASVGEVSRAWGASARAPLTQLRDTALVWGSDRTLRLVRTVRDLLGAHPAGLGPPIAEALGRRSPSRIADLLADLGLPPTGDVETALARLAEHLGDAEALESLLRKAPDRTRELLDQLVWGPPVGAVSPGDRSRVRAADAASPVDWLLARGVLAVADPGHVVLPREVALALRGGRVFAQAAASPPRPSPTEVPAHRRDSAGAAAADELLRQVEALAEIWSLAPPALLRAGGLGVRDLKRTSSTLDVPEASAAFIVELAYLAGLVAQDGETDPVWAPTPGYDVWAGWDAGRRWTALVRAWLPSTRVPALVGTPSERTGPRAALGPEVERSSAPAVRGAVLAQLAAAGGTVSEADVEAALDWQAPRRRGALRDLLISATLREAAWLGVTGAGALTAAGALMLAGDDAGAADLVDGALPHPVDQVMLQADLTAVAPGPLHRDLRRELALVAEVESRGAATVYRFTPAAVRRALDAGRTAEELVAFLTAHSSTPVPQPLAYLISDTARRHGRVRVGRAGSYLRADDEAVLAELLADRRAGSLRLRRLAPTVLAAQAPPETVLEVLRGLGLAPAAESPEGDVLLHRPDAHRTPARQPPKPLAVEPPARDEAGLLALVAHLRAGDALSREQAREASGQPGPRLPSMDPATALAALRSAATQGQRVWIGYVDADGGTSRRLILPRWVDGGRVTAFDTSIAELRDFSVHRVTGVVPEA